MVEKSYFIDRKPYLGLCLVGLSVFGVLLSHGKQIRTFLFDTRQKHSMGIVWNVSFSFMDCADVGLSLVHTKTFSQN
jgi:hypothetical protein